jgi:tetratricopeptide (TPR) repeat protein
MDQASLKAGLGRAAALLPTDPPGAEREARAVLRLAAGDPNATLILSSALRRQGKAAEALGLLQPLARAFPRAALTQFELGMALADVGQSAPAIAALKAATQLDRENPDAWRALGALLFDTGDARGAEAAFAEHHRALVRDPRLKPAAEALHAGRFAEAEQLLRPIATANPNDLAAVGLLADALLRQERYADAATLFVQVLERAPDDEQTRFRLARALFRQQKAAEALPHLERLLAIEPHNAAYRNLMAGALALAGEFDRAMTLYEDLLRTYANQPQIWLNYGHALRAVGRSDEATAAFRRCIGFDPTLAEAYLGLANMKVASFTDAEVAAMRAIAERRDLPSSERQQLDFALGKALEDRGDYAASFASYAAAAALRRAETPYDAGAFTAQTRRSKAMFSADFFAERTGFGAEAADPIFIVGLPRSGSTLIEQILASHSAVEGTMELPDIGFIADSLGAYPSGVAGLTADGARALGEGYIASTRMQRKLGRPFFIDKMPNNFQYLGLIDLILPNARVIDARRHPLATCFSAFKQHFAQGQAFSYDLADLGRYYRDYVELMAHFDAARPGRVCRVIYEDLIENTEGQVRRLLDHLGLPFEPACLTFYETDRAVRTVSSEQVRRPIFRDGLDQWRNYEPWLGPLKDALGPALQGWR